LIIVAGTLLFGASLLFQVLYTTGVTATGFASWRPVLYAYVLWALAVTFGQMLIRGERGQRAAFLLSPLTKFGAADSVRRSRFGQDLCDGDETGDGCSRRPDRDLG